MGELLSRELGVTAATLDEPDEAANDDGFPDPFASLVRWAR